MVGCRPKYFSSKMSEKLEVTSEWDLKDWSTRMKHIYDNGLAKTHVLHVHGVDYGVNAAVLHAALPNIPANRWEETFNTVKSDLVKDILRFLYTFEVPISLSKVKDILRASNVLRLSHLQDACEQFVMDNLNPHNYIGWMHFSEEEKFHNLATVCKEKISKELNLISQCKEFQELSFAEAYDLIKEQAADQADTQFHAIMSWILVDEDRYKFVEELIDLIDLTKCSRACLKRVVVEPYDKLFQTVPLQRKLLQASLSDTSLYEANEEIKYVPGDDEANIQQEHMLDFKDKYIADFAKSMIAKFENFLMNTMHTDMTVKFTDKKSIKAHQVVLAAGSPYFEAVVRRSVDEQNEQTSSQIIHTDLLQFDPVTAEALVEYTYSKKIEFSNRELLDYLHGCDFLQLGILLQECRSHAEKSLTISEENCFQWLIGSKLFNLQQTKERAVRFICTNFEKVHKTEHLLNLGHDDIVEVLNNDALGSIPEQVLYEAIIFWIMHNQSERSHLTEFLQSNAVKRCSADMKLDMHAIMRDKEFDVSETHQIWEAHYARLAEKLTDVQKTENKKEKEWDTKHSQVREDNSQLRSKLSNVEKDLRSKDQTIDNLRSQLRSRGIYPRY